MMHSRTGARFFMRLSLVVGGEIVAGKPDWLRKLEEEQSAKLIAQNQAGEITASHSKILKDGAPKLWERIESAILNALEHSELQGVIFNPVPMGPAGTRIIISSKLPLQQSETMDVMFRPESQKIETFHPAGNHDPVTLFLGVSNGRIILRDSAGVLPDDEENDLAEVACQRLLEPVLRSYIRT